jgi:hypothetical protein
MSPYINSQIDSSNFTCDWYSFYNWYCLVALAPSHSQCAVFDVNSVSSMMMALCKLTMLHVLAAQVALGSLVGWPMQLWVVIITNTKE